MNMKYDLKHTFVTSDHHFREWAHLGGVLAESTQEEEALGVLAEMNAILRKMPISEAVKKERFGRLQNRLNSLGWLGLCDERTFAVKSDGCWTQLKLVDLDSDEASAIP